METIYLSEISDHKNFRQSVLAIARKYLAATKKKKKRKILLPPFKEYSFFFSNKFGGGKLKKKNKIKLSVTLFTFSNK